MIKLGTRRALRALGTVLVVNVKLEGWDDSGNRITHLVGGDLLMLTSKQYNGRLEAVNVANGCKLWIWRDWLVKNTSLAFDAR